MSNYSNYAKKITIPNWTFGQWSFFRSIRLIRVISFLPIFTIYYLLFTIPARAQSSRTLTVVPPIQNFSAKPGKQIQFNIKVRNESNEPLTIKAAFKDFIVIDEKGTPRMVDEEISGRYSLASWLTISPTEFTIFGRSSKVFDGLIIIPDDAFPGGHYAAIYFNPVDTVYLANQSGSGIESRISSLVKLDVEGPVTETALVRRFRVPKFSEYGPVTFTTQIENLSEIDVTPKGKIVIQNFFGQKKTELKLEERRIFPYALRTYVNTWEIKWLFGRYKATLTAAYGKTGQALIAYQYFWVFPWKITLIIILTVSIFILLGYWLGHRKIKEEEEMEEMEI